MTLESTTRKQRMALQSVEDCVYRPTEELMNEILSKAHNTPYTTHPGSTKMYQISKKKIHVGRHEERHSLIR